MKKLAIIGSNGMLGSDLVKYLSPFYHVTSITKENYSQHVHSEFNLLINANGNSKRFWANQNPQDDFVASTVSVYKSIFDFSSDLYIYISSPDVYENHIIPESTAEDVEINPEKLQPYGFHKYLSEMIIKKYKMKYLILRSSMVLGNNLKKGPFYDIIHKRPIFVSSQTRLQLITTRVIADILNTLFKKNVVNETINVGGIGTFDFNKIQTYFKKEIKYSAQAKTQVYEMNVGKVKSLYPTLKTSTEYLQEFLRDII